MKCPHCQEVDSKVIESRDVADGEAIRRRRQCQNCNQRYTTYERLEYPHLVVVKKDGTRELFNRNKLIAGLQRACEKTPVTSMQIEDLVAEVERDLYARGENELSSRDVGELVMQKLADLNEVAYVRFASVYRSFKDIQSFEKALQMIKNKDQGG
ncbi:transcriptional repressor NrdR [Candidatus Saccharibacteria bacterium CPR2]|nr:transcriptional repressor NrdR [Candidatus Saccharibacteria bacterium CPR2]